MKQKRARDDDSGDAAAAAAAAAAGAAVRGAYTFGWRFLSFSTASLSMILIANAAPSRLRRARTCA